MSRRLARAALSLYRWGGVALYPIVGPYLALRAAKGKEERARRRERYGVSGVPRPPGPLVWFHAASVGETLAVVPLVKEVRRRGIAVVLTTGTVTSAKVVRDRLGGSCARYRRARRARAASPAGSCAKGRCRRRPCPLPSEHRW